MTIFVVDNESLARKHIRSLVSDCCPNAEVYDFCSGEDAVAAASVHQPDVAFMDIEMSGINGLDAANSLKKLNPQVKA